jgi:hypothetical protein
VSARHFAFEREREKDDATKTRHRGLGIRLGGQPRAAQFAMATTPLLFVAGSDAPYADIDEMTLVVGGIGVDSELRIIDNADHGFSVPDVNDVDVLVQIADIISDWVAIRIGNDG